MGRGCGVRGMLFLGMGLILLIVVGLLFYNRSVERDARSLAGEMDVSGTSARQALAPAVELAVQWQEDAQLAVVSRQWLEAGKHVGTDDGWAFQFFSPSARRLALVTVTGGTASLARESSSPYTVPTFSADEWQVDSDQALGIWWERGGQNLLVRRPDATLVIQLRVPEEGGEHPVWTVAGFAGTESVISVALDGTDGAVVER